MLLCESIWRCWHKAATLILLVMGLFTALVASAQNKPALAWDALTKEYQAKAGEATAQFTFWMTNTTAAPITIRQVETSCGCTTAEMPRNPWIIAPGAAEKLPVTVEFVGKYGTLQKRVLVDASSGAMVLLVKVEIPESPSDAPQNRTRNLITALSNRQSVFQGDCARCHAKPTEGKTGGDLFAAACGVCHSSPTRASMVPDLHQLKKPTDAAYWRQWITLGKEGSLMPAFAKEKGGPLSGEQIQTLVDYLVVSFPSGKTTPVHQP